MFKNKKKKDEEIVKLNYQVEVLNSKINLLNFRYVHLINTNGAIHKNSFSTAIIENKEANNSMNESSCARPCCIMQDLDPQSEIGSSNLITNKNMYENLLNLVSRERFFSSNSCNNNISSIPDTFPSVGCPENTPRTRTTMLKGKRKNSNMLVPKISNDMVLTNTNSDINKPLLNQLSFLPMDSLTHILQLNNHLQSHTKKSFCSNNFRNRFDSIRKFSDFCTNNFGSNIDEDDEFKLLRDIYNPKLLSRKVSNNLFQDTENNPN